MGGVAFFYFSRRYALRRRSKLQDGPKRRPREPKSAPRAPKVAPRRCRLEPPWELLGGSWGFLGASRTSRSHLQDSAFLFKCMPPRSQKKANPPSKNAIWGFAGGSQDGPKTAQKTSPRRVDQIILCELSFDLLSNLGSSSLPKMCILCGRGRIFGSFGDLRFHTPEVALRGSKTALRALGLTSNMLKNATPPTQNAHFWPPKTAPRRVQDDSNMHRKVIFFHLVAHHAILSAMFGQVASKLPPRRLKMAT